jgi:hypothetical protein
MGADKGIKREQQMRLTPFRSSSFKKGGLLVAFFNSVHLCLPNIVASSATMKSLEAAYYEFVHIMV